MSEFFSNLSAFTVFLSIAAIGFLFLLVSVIFGDLFGHDFDHGFDHDMDHGGPGLLSPRIISVFITAFGGVGAIAISQGYRVFPASAFGVAAGFVLGGLVYFFARFLYSQQATSTISTSDLVGRTAQVIVGIPAKGVGQVRCLVGETMIDKIARSSDGGEIASNSVVKIEQIVGESVIVSRAETAEAAGPPK
ncbi:MAG TPA: hypothetical protein VFV34_29340 [Blastocatellia bacterium]|nr:hypothetical protein [Blastocatellia bacterium]